MYRTLLNVLSPAGREARLSILIFHRVLPRVDPLFPEEVDAARFDAQCRWIREWFRVLPLDEAAMQLREGRLPARALAITFDDGYADNHHVAMPLLQKHGLTATFFVATGFLDGGRMWNDTVIEAVRRAPAGRLDLAGTVAAPLGAFELGDDAQRRAVIDALIRGVKYQEPEERLRWVQAIAERCGAALPNDLMMTSDQVRGLRRGGMQVGAHTVNHPILARLPAAQARREIDDSRRWLQDLLGEPVRVFAYPNGKPGEDYGDEAVGLVRELGFETAVSTRWGAAHAGSDPLQLPRFSPWDRSRSRYAARLAHNLWASRQAA